MVKHVLHVQPTIVPDTLEWRLEPNQWEGSITLECRELGNKNDSGWNSVVSIGTDGKLYQHEYIGTNLLSLVGCREVEIVPEIPRVAWNKNVEELKQHYGKLVTLVLKDGGSCSKIRHGVLSGVFSKTPGFSGFWTLTGYPNSPDATYNYANIEKFCVHELPRD